MPEVAFSLTWPDGTRMSCRSPSTILHRHLAAATYDVADFLARARSGLAAASARVQEVHGFPCAQAAGQLQAIEAMGRRFDGWPDARVTVEFA